MTQITATFTVFFEAPFWKGVYERQEQHLFSTALVVFGAEPKDIEILKFMTTNFDTLSFSKAVEMPKCKTIQNYKKRQKNIRKQTKQNGISTKSQQALQQQREQFKTVSKANRKQLKQALQKKQFEMKQQKKKQKKKGH